MKEMQPSWVGHLLGGRYQVESLLRHGEISSLYHAIDKRTKHPVLIEIIYPSLSQHADFKSHFEQELSAIIKLRHPMIQPISDFACSEESCYVVLPHVPGDTLAQRLASLHTAHLRLPFDDTIDIMSKLCEAVSYAHEHNVVHGELNPSHIIIDLGGEPLITYFGMANLLTHERVGETINRMNTAIYASPERISGQTVDRRADIYALGVILYEMIAGHPPFYGDTVTTVVEKHLYDPVPDIRLFNPNSHNSRHQRDRAIPYGMMTVLQKALAKNPDERFWSVSEMAGALQMMSLKTVVLSEDELEDVSSLAKSLSMSTKSAQTPAKTAPSTRFASRRLKGMLLCMLILLALLSLVSFLSMSESFSIFLTSLSHGQVTEPVAVSTIQAEQPLPTATTENKPITPVPPTMETTQTEPTLAPPGRDNQPVTSQNMRKITGGRYLVSEEPTLDVELSDFWIDQYEVSNAKYAQFVAETGAIAPAYWQDKQIPEKMGTHPVQAVSWEEASAYCAWVNKRLPSEIEWEIAARGPYSWRFPWGNDAQLLTLPEQERYPVGSMLENRSFFGVFDMAGNATEWVDAPYLSKTTEDEGHVLRGGLGNTEDALMGRFSGEEAQANVTRAGFRCASSHVEPEREPEANILLYDDFSDASSGWWQADAPKEGYFYGYDAPDVYQITVDSANSCLSVHHEMPTDHIMIETEISTANPEAINSKARYGVTVRATNNNFYAFVISPHNQRWQVLKSTAEGLLLMDEGSTETITGIKQEISDKLAVISNYSEFTFFVNGELVSRVHDNQYHSGHIGFMVETFDQPTAQLHVDSITVYALPTEIQRSAGINPSTADYWLNSPICEGSVLNSNRLTRFISHTVRRGQSLNKIARRYGVPMTDILSVNGLKITNANLIKRGQILIIPQYE